MNSRNTGLHFISEFTFSCGSHLVFNTVTLPLETLQFKVPQKVKEISYLLHDILSP
jgi:hypothetical protein